MLRIFVYFCVFLCDRPVFLCIFVCALRVSCVCALCVFVSRFVHFDVDNMYAICVYCVFSCDLPVFCV